MNFNNKSSETLLLSVLSLLCLILINVGPTNGRIITIDLKEDMNALGSDFYMSHVEFNEYFETMEELLGVWDISQKNNTKRGIWVYKSHGVGGCCGGSLDFMFVGKNLFQIGDKVQVEVIYYSNSQLSVYPVVGEGQHSFAASEGEPLNWTTVKADIDADLTISTGYSVDIGTKLGVVERYGYFILDKITFYINEPAPLKILTH